LPAKTLITRSFPHITSTATAIQKQIQLGVLRFLNAAESKSKAIETAIGLHSIGAPQR
jgi:hypothetical protein